MGWWQNFQVGSELIVCIHTLLFFQPGMATIIVKSKSTWLRSARQDVIKGARVGDVAALVVVDFIAKSLVSDAAMERSMVEELSSELPFHQLGLANLAIVATMSNASTLYLPNYSGKLGSVVAARYAQQIARPSERASVTNALIIAAADHERSMRVMTRPIRPVNES